MNALEQRVRTLETAVAALEDRCAIQDLRFRYHIAVNDGGLDSIAALFSEDGEVHFEGIGSAQGRNEIDALYRDVVGSSPFVKQFIHNHAITLHGPIPVTKIHVQVNFLSFIREGLFRNTGLAEGNV